MSLPFIALTAAGIACILYGIMVMLIRSGTMFFAVWLALGGFLVLLGRLTRIRFWDMMPRFVKAVLVCVLVVGLLIFGACEVMVLSGFGTSAPPGADYLIVLGAQVRPDGPSVVLRYRLDAAADYLRNNEGTRCIVTGGRGRNEHISEGEGMKQYLVGLGIGEDRIIVEDQAVNTIQNIQFSKALILADSGESALADGTGGGESGKGGAGSGGAGSDPAAGSEVSMPVAVVTNNFHVARAVRLARKQGFTNVSAVSAPSDPLYLPNNMFREFFGFAKDFIEGNLDIF